MTEEKKTTVDNEELQKKLKEIEHKIDSISKNKIADSEDQLFFGVIISFLILFLTLPLDDVTLFFENSLNFSFETASIIAQFIRDLGIVLFLFSAITRYYAVVGNQNASKKYRYVSLEGFMFAFASILTIVSINLISPLSSFLSYNISILVILVVLNILFMSLIHVEEKILQFYASKTITAKKYTFPFSSFVWECYAFGNTFALFTMLLAINIGIRDVGVLEQLLKLYGIYSFYFGFIFVLKWINFKPAKDSDYYKWKKSLQSLRHKLSKKF